MLLAESKRGTVEMIRRDTAIVVVPEDHKQVRWSAKTMGQL